MIAPAPALADGSPILRLTVEQYHRMIELGICEAGPYELLDGLIVHKNRAAAGEDPITVGDEHAWVINRLIRLAAKFDPLGSHLQVQLPIVIAPRGEPEPDAAVIDGSEDDYLAGKPTPAQAHCVIEVADSSLGFDRGNKLKMYARAGIPQYIIVNLVGEVIEVYQHPETEAGEYDPPLLLRGGQTLAIRAGRAGSVEVAASYLLPPTPATPVSPTR